MADVITSTQAVLQEDVVSARVLSVLTASAVVQGAAADDYTAQIRPGMDRLSIPSYGNFTVVKKTPGTAVDAATNAFSQSELLLDEHAVIQFLIERRAELQSKIMIADKYLEQGARDMAAQMDADRIGDLEADGTALSLATPGVLAKADILDAARVMDNADIPSEGRFAVIHGDEKADLLGITDFTRVNEAGSNRALRNGEVGELFGFTFLVSSQKTAANVTFYHRTGLAVGMQKAMTVDQDKDLANLADRWSIDMLYGQQVTDSARVLNYT